MVDNPYVGILWNMAINGVQIDEARRFCIKSVSLSTQCDGSDTLTVVVQDPEFIFINDNIFIEESKIYFRMNIQDDITVIEFEGYISAIDIEFPDTGMPTLTLTCLDKTHIMNRKKKNRSWDNTTSANVVKTIAREYGFQCVVESGYSFGSQDTITQSNQTDIEFIEQLASNERDLFMAKLVDNTLYYVKKGLLKTPSATFTYKYFPFNIISFSPKINKESIQEETYSGNINSDTKSTEISVSTSQNTSRDVQGDPVKTSSSQTGGNSSESSSPNHKYDPSTGKWVKK